MPTAAAGADAATAAAACTSRTAARPRCPGGHVGAPTRAHWGTIPTAAPSTGRACVRATRTPGALRPAAAASAASAAAAAAVAVRSWSAHDCHAGNGDASPGRGAGGKTSTRRACKCRRPTGAVQAAAEAAGGGRGEAVGKLLPPAGGRQKPAAAAPRDTRQRNMVVAACRESGNEKDPANGEGEGEDAGGRGGKQEGHGKEAERSTCADDVDSLRELSR